MNIDYIKDLITGLGFIPQNGSNGIYIKYYAQHENYIVIVDFNARKLIYDSSSIPLEKRIRLGDKSTCNFDKPENFVVLECVDRLLSKGYSPSCIELEKKYPLGRINKGKLDILVYELDKTTPFLMIECKTWGSEFDKESAKTIKDGGQIFSYYQQDTSAKFLCLYASRFDKEKVDYRNNIILVDNSWHELSNANDVHGHWNKNYKDNGIFEDGATPYDIKPKALTYGMLKNLKEEDSGKIFNQIMEILRHNAISDKPNAFNKLLNLFVCKIIDENRNPDEELEFQWLDTDTNESLQMRLNDLYKKGMWRFLEIKVIDHSEEEVEKALEGIENATQKQQLLDMFRDARLKKSPNFAFAEVLDERTFELNAKIVREIVELLQVYKFRYAQKHEFLGNFFELLLNTSMKQEAGQFFTPVPITRFIISSLPLKEFVQKRIDHKDSEILPAVIDYACGSGHFLTEYMDQMQSIIEKKIDVAKASPDVRNAVMAWQGPTKFLWAKDSVYGIDLDNRLVKTTKVSAFFNGDGEANIIWANGLGNFEKTEEYRGLLKHSQPYERKNNGKFDILISNPPYSVDAFKSTLKYGDEAFDLYSNLTDNSKEIECLFVERMKQLLKVGGWAAVILPSSILSNGGIYSRTREIIFKYFKIISIVEFGSGTFMKTGTNTIGLFLERRSDNDCIAVERAVKTFIQNQNDVTVLGIENAFSKYVASVYDNLCLDDYISFIKGKVNNNMQKHELFVDYQKTFGSDCYTQGVELEKEKMLYFMLTYSQNTVVVKTGSKQEEKDFLGYEFSERRGHEGMKHLPNGTKLYDRSGNLLNPQKANSYIYKAFLGQITNEIDESLAKNITIRQLRGLINFGTSKFDKIVNLKQKQKIVLDFSNAHAVMLGDIAKVEKGQNLTSAQAKPGDIPVVAGGLRPTIYHNASNRVAGMITVSASGANAGYVNYWNTPIFATDCNTINSKDEKIALTKYIYICLKSLQPQIYCLQAGQAQPHVYERDLVNIKIPLPPLDVQQAIVDEFEAIELKEGICLEDIQTQQSYIDDCINECFSKNYSFEQLGSIAQIFNGGTPSTTNESYWNGKINWATLVDTKNKYLYTTQRTITEEGLKNCNATLLPINAVLFSSRATIGDVSIAKIPVCTNQGYKNFVCDSSKLNYEYLYYVLKHEAKAIEDMVKGMIYPEISKSLIETYKIPVPTLNEQLDIITKVNKVEADISILKTKLTELRIQKSNLLKKYLHVN